MRPYETMIIFDTEHDEAAVQAVLTTAGDIVRSHGGNPGSVHRWGKRTLAYEVNHKSEGYYVVFEFTAEPTVTSELDRMLSLADEVLRHKVIRLPDRAGGTALPDAAAAAPAKRTAPAESEVPAPVGEPG